MGSEHAQNQSFQKRNGASLNLRLMDRSIEGEFRPSQFLVMRYRYGVIKTKLDAGQSSFPDFPSGVVIGNIADVMDIPVDY